MQVSETETADGILTLIALGCPVRAVPQLGTRDASLSPLVVPALGAGTGGSMMLSEMYELPQGAFLS